MKRSVPLLVILLVAGVGGGAFYARQTGAKLPLIPVKQATLPAGTSVELMLLDKLESGGSKEGEIVSFMVAKDVLAPDGTRVIPKGSRGEAKVSWSRGEGLLSAVSNKPARLAIELNKVTVDGISVAIEAEPGDKKYEFNRANTGGQDLIQRLQDVYSKPEEKEKINKLADTLKRGPNLSDSSDREEISKVAKDLGLNALSDALSTDRYKELQGAVDGLGNQAGDLRKLSGSNLLIAALEYRTLFSGVTGTVGNMLKGRQIRAYPGTLIKVQTSSEQKLSAR